jgi:cold shock protein
MRRNEANSRANCNPFHLQLQENSLKLTVGMLECRGFLRQETSQDAVIDRPRPRAAGGFRKDCAMAQTGTIKFFNADKGYGFIKPDDGGRDIFVHITAVERAGLTTLAEGQKISFDVEPDKKGKGPKAVDLVLM